MQDRIAALISARHLTPIRERDYVSIFAASDTPMADSFAEATSLFPSEFSHCTQERAEAYLIDAATWGDYCGTTVERANQLTLKEEFPDLLTVVYPYSTSSLAGQAPIAEELIERLEELDGYPLLDEGVHSDVETALETEIVEWIIDDEFRGASPELRTELLDAYYRSIEDENDYFISENAVSGYHACAEQHLQTAKEAGHAFDPDFFESE